MRTVHDTANATGLLQPQDIKVPLNPFADYLVAGEKGDFIHVFGNIMEGRTIAQKADLSEKIILALQPKFPNLPILSINIREFVRATYCNRNLV